MPLSQIKWVNAPMYDEVSVVRIWPEMQEEEEFMQFFPASMPKGRLPDRTYFFNILNTVSEQYMQAIIRHASEQRNTANAEAKAIATIQVSEEWWDKLNSVPFKSGKYKLQSHIK